MDSRSVFIGGCSGSGTTLLRAILDSHSKIKCGPELCIFDRPFIINTPYEVFLKLLKNDLVLSEPKGSGLALKGAYKFGYLKFFLRQNSPDQTKSHFYPIESRDDNLAYYVESWDQVIELAEKASNYPEFFEKFFLGDNFSEGMTWVEKSPRNIYFSKELLEVFSDSQFVYVYREPLDTIASLTRRKFSQKSREQAVNQFIKSYKCYENINGDERLFFLSYEGLIANPEKVVSDLMSFLGLSFEDSQMAFYNEKRTGMSGYAETPINDSQVGRWKKDLSSDDLKYIVNRFKNEGLGALLPVIVMSNEMRVFHGVTGAAGQPWSISRAQRRLGVDAQSFLVGANQYGYNADHMLPVSKNMNGMFHEVLVNEIDKFDVFHFYFRSLFYEKTNLKFPTGIDLVLLRAAGKVAIMNFRGSEVRIHSKFKNSRHSITWTKIPMG